MNNPQRASGPVLWDLAPEHSEARKHKSLMNSRSAKIRAANLSLQRGVFDSSLGWKLRWIVLGSEKSVPRPVAERRSLPVVLEVKQENFEEP